MSVATGAERPVLVVADRIALGGDTGPVVGGVAQPVVGRLSPRHDHALTRTAGDWSHPAETAKCVVVPSPHRVVALGKQRGEHLVADAEQRQQDGRIGRFCRRWFVLGGRVRVVCRSSLGELMHQPVELAAHVLELAVDQGEAFGRRAVHA